MRVRLEKNSVPLDLGGEPFARGGEAAIYPVADRPELLAKVYHAPTPEQADKLAAMIANPPADPTAKQGHTSIAWPTDRLFDPEAAESRCVGFVMPRVDKVKSLLEVYNPKARLQTWPLFHYGYLMRTARNLAIAVRALHARGYVLGDLNESNVLVNAQALVTIVDTDSFQTRTADRVFRCMVGKPEYIAPEIQNANFADVDRRLEHDHFALAVLIFQLLMQGTHPFAGFFTGEGEPAVLAKRIAAGHWAYAKTRTGPYAPNPLAPPFIVLPPQVRELMRLCFEEGHEHPTARPDAGRWQKALAEADEQLTDCLVNGQHKFHKSLDACPWCELTVKQGRDPFPARARPAPAALPEAPAASTAVTPIPTQSAEVVPLRMPAPRLASAPGVRAFGAPSFWTTPWPWALGGGGAALIAIFVTAVTLASIALWPSPKPQLLMTAGYSAPFPQPQPPVFDPGPKDGPPAGEGDPRAGAEGPMIPGPMGAGAMRPGPLPQGELPDGGGNVRRPGVEPPVGRRQAPELLAPIESRVATVRFAMPSYVFDKDFTSVLALKAAAGGPAAFPPRGAPMPGGPGVGVGPPGGPAMPNNPKGPPLAAKLRMRGHALIPDRGDGDFDMEWIRLDGIADHPDANLAEQVYPVRAAEVVAAFPYRKQVKEFQDKLGLASEAEVLQDSAEPAPAGQPSAAFHFVGLRVERRRVDALGQPAGEDAEWKPLDLDGDYNALLALNGDRTEDEDDLNPVIIPNLAMKKIATFGARRTPPEEDYPAIEKGLVNLRAALNALGEHPGGLGRDPFDPNKDGPRQAPPAFPGQDDPMARPGGPGPVGPMGRPGVGPRPPGVDAPLPEQCLIRFFDVTIEPGKTYEYRMKVRMANPNRGRKDAAPGVDATSQELEPKDWYVVPQKATLAPDLAFYCVDQKDLDANNPASFPPGGRPLYQPVRSWETVVQVHRWVDYLPLPGRRGELPVGVWVIAERVVAGRGEPLPRPRVEAAYWRTAQAAFAMAWDAPRPGMPRPAGPPRVEMPLAPDGDEPILVDFTRGDLTYLRTQPKTEEQATEKPQMVQDRALSEVLLCTADGRLLAHNTPVDAADPWRAARLNAVRAWIDKVKAPANGRPFGNPFGQ